MPQKLAAITFVKQTELMKLNGDDKKAAFLMHERLQKPPPINKPNN